MGVGDQQVADRFAGDRLRHRLHMGGVVGAGIENGDGAAADDVGAGSGVGEGRRILRQHPAHQGRQPFHLAIGRAFRGIGHVFP